MDKTSPVPLYFQIAENLRAAIESGALRPGERLGNEIQLSERLSVSRPTVRQAIQRLAHEGLVVRQRGVGTVVINRRIQRPLALSSLYEDLKTAGREPATTVLSVTPNEAEGETAAALGLPAGHPVLMIDRLRMADVMAVLTQYGLYETLRQQDVQFHSAEEVIGARKATAAEAQLLQVPRNSTVLTMSRVALDPTGRVIEYGLHAYLAERYSFRVTFGPVPQ